MSYKEVDGVDGILIQTQELQPQNEVQDFKGSWSTWADTRSAHDSIMSVRNRPVAGCYAAGTCLGARQQFRQPAGWARLHRLTFHWVRQISVEKLMVWSISDMIPQSAKMSIEQIFITHRYVEKMRIVRFSFISPPKWSCKIMILKPDSSRRKRWTESDLIWG